MFMVRKKKLLFFGLCLSTMFTFGQNLSIRQCVDYATKNNESQKIASYEILVAKQKVNEQLGTMLPQIDGSVSYVNNLKLQKSVLPGAMFGSPTDLTITMGTQYNGAAGLQLTQKIFDPTFPVALKAAKLNQQYYQQSQQKTLEQTVYKVSSSYYQCLIIAKQYSKLQAILASTEKLLTITELKFKNGMANKIDLDKIKVSYNSVRSQLDQCDLNYKQSLNSLKHQMGMPIETAIVLTDTTSVEINIERAFDIIKNEVDLENLVDFQLQKTNLKVQELQKRQQVMGYLPSLSFSAAYNYNAIRKEFDFLDQNLPWYNSSNIAFSLKVPVFDGFQKKSKIAQSRLNILIAKENVNMMERSIKLNVANYEMQYKDAIDNIRNEKENFELAQSVYVNSQLQYKEGLGTALDLVQAESSLRESQNNYFNKLFSLFIARLDLEQSKGTLMNYINNFK
jgi:outer membrane protein TolC